ncbi:MAG: hypothetical protein LBF71_02680 [Campylobacteraceae bacterium]|jgi:acid stress-induced BolA-like protein IbaG/YrbA|nr:hypothetical protein [Campylobacteraceae bacterium]
MTQEKIKSIIEQKKTVKVFEIEVKSDEYDDFYVSAIFNDDFIKGEEKS